MRHTLFLTADGSLWGLGKRHDGRLGQNATSGHNSTPHQISTVMSPNVRRGMTHNLFVKSDGSLWGMGANNKGQLGDGTNQSRLNPVQIVDKNVSKASAGYNSSVFLKTDGSVWSMGSNYRGKLGYGGLTDQNIPVLVMASERRKYQSVTTASPLSKRMVRSGYLEINGVAGWASMKNLTATRPFR